ncbi:hypothetical protein CKO28_14255 [Rhodovibrio sodomensis]|uniref:Organic solvent tolerance-like N-terminal domain-containing protein n=2 Tax=Rhodovibrio sodomensis TaxID=1088 RepID=A0ABS1DFE1_9PROT|nr:hypothetical protein [Rhodovibrio sodomensis]
MPSAPGNADNSVVVDDPKGEVWDRLVPRLSKNFYVINNLDRDSGLINVSYSGDPGRFVDCGQIHSYVKNARGERNYRFPATTPQKSYEIMQGGTLYFVDRRMELEGRMNVILEAVSDAKTRVTANTRYVVTKSGTIRNTQGQSRSFSDTIKFDTGGRAAFPNPNYEDQTTCVPNGRLEESVLDLVD